MFLVLEMKIQIKRMSEERYQFKVAPPIVARTKVGRTKVAPHIVGPNQSWPGPKLSQPKVAPAQSWPSPKLSQL